MTAVLTTASTIKCLHGGSVSLSSGAKLKVDGKPVLIQSAVSNWSFSACAPKTNAGEVACTQVSAIAPTASKLKANGSPVILEGTAASNGTPPTLTETANDSKLSAS
jgi:uncharacterized Zn-binding protein involved in type VI secretion